MSSRRYRGRGSGPRPFDDRQNWVDNEPTPPIPFQDQGEAATAERDMEAGKCLEKENINPKRPVRVAFRTRCPYFGTLHNTNNGFCFVCFVEKLNKSELWREVYIPGDLQHDQ